MTNKIDLQWMKHTLLHDIFCLWRQCQTQKSHEQKIIFWPNLVCKIRTVMLLNMIVKSSDIRILLLAAVFMWFSWPDMPELLFSCSCTVSFQRPRNVLFDSLQFVQRSHWSASLGIMKQKSMEAETELDLSFCCCIQFDWNGQGLGVWSVADWCHNSTVASSRAYGKRARVQVRWHRSG